MKVSTFGLDDLAPGKQKYVPDEFKKLVAKFEPQKETPFTMEFVPEEFDKTDAVVFSDEKKLDLVLIDLEKIETRLQRSEDAKEKELLARCQKLLEGEQLLCDQDFSDQEQAMLKILMLVTFKPAVGIDSADDIKAVIEAVLDKSGYILFYTAGKKEVHAWLTKKGSTMVEAAGKIHSDLARGFIKADVVNIKRLDEFFNMAEAKAKGMVESVDRDRLIQSGDIIDVKFSV